mgnify:CR=1 FL=1
MRTRKPTRRRALYEESEIENVSIADKMTGSTRLSLDSADDQIDSYIIKFEAEAAEAVESEEEMIFEFYPREEFWQMLSYQLID